MLRCALITFFLLLFFHASSWFAACTTAEECAFQEANNNIVGRGETSNILWKSEMDLRTGNVTMEDIPMMIASAIEYLLAIAGAVCVVALIYHAVRMQFASGITGDSTWVDKAKKWIYGSVLGFVLSMSAWFIMTKLVALLASTTWS